MELRFGVALFLGPGVILSVLLTPLGDHEAEPVHFGLSPLANVDLLATHFLPSEFPKALNLASEKLTNILIALFITVFKSLHTSAMLEAHLELADI